MKPSGTFRFTFLYKQTESLEFSGQAKWTDNFLCPISFIQLNLINSI